MEYVIPTSVRVSPQKSYLRGFLTHGREFETLQTRCYDNRSVLPNIQTMETEIGTEGMNYYTFRFNMKQHTKNSIISKSSIFINSFHYIYYIFNRPFSSSDLNNLVVHLGFWVGDLR